MYGRSGESFCCFSLVVLFMLFAVCGRGCGESRNDGLRSNETKMTTDGHLILCFYVSVGSCCVIKASGCGRRCVRKMSIRILVGLSLIHI